MTNGKKKVLFLIHTLGGGGAERVLVDTVNKIDKTKFDVTVMTVIDTGINKERLTEDVTYKTIIKPPFFIKPKSKSGSLSANSKSKVKFLGGLYTWLWRVLPTKLIYKYSIKEKYDIEIAFLEGIASKLIAASDNPKSRKIAWIHVDFKSEHKSAAVFSSVERERQCYDKFDQLVAVSNETKHGFCDIVGIDEDAVEVVHNVLDVQDVVKKSKQKSDIEFNNNALNIISVGRLAPQKGYDRLLRVAKRLNDDYAKKYNLYIVGDGPERTLLQGYIDMHNLSNVHLCGYLSNPYAVVARSDLFVISSRAEGFSTVMTEAVALEVPLVTSRVSGTEQLPDGVVVDNNEDALYDKLSSLLGDKKMYISHKKHAARLKKQFETLNIESLKIIEEQLCAKKD